MLGDKIRQHRKLNHMSQEELADKLGVSRQSISLWENNQTQPTIENIVVLSKLLGISTDELLSADSSVSEDSANSCGTIPPMQVTTSTVVSPPIETEDPIPTRDMNVKPTVRKKRKKSLLIAVPILVLLLLVAGIAIWAFTKGTPEMGTELSAEEIYNKISPSVVEIYAESSTESSTGTGFFLDDKGTVVTNYHVIEDCQTAKITLANGSSYQVTAVKGYDANRDIAILSTKCTTSTPLSIRKTSVKTGEKVYAIGSSLGLTGSLSDGIISAVNREVEGNVYIQTTAPISHGNSGGPLVDAKGQVVGIVCASFTEGQNLNLAIPISAIEEISVDTKITLKDLFPEVQPEVEWISDWRFSYYADENTYVLLFQLADKDENPISTSGTVEIRIINSDNTTVYSKTHYFTAANFEEWIYDDTDEMYLATIYISPQSIKGGSTAYGTVYFEVYGEGYSFEECTEDVDCLPTGNDSSAKPQTVGVRTISFSDKFTAEYVLATWENGDRSEKSLIALMDEYGAQQGGGQLYTISPGDFIEEIDEWCFSSERKEGDYAIIENAYGFSLCYISSISWGDVSGGSTAPNSPEQDSTNQTRYICLEPSCNNSVSNDGDYCSTHRCQTSGCPYSKDAGSNYCSVCSCYTVGCKNPHITNGYYCTTHTCKASGCTSEKDTSSDYCFLHKSNGSTTPPTTQPTQYTCLKSSCNNVVSKSGEYCSEHKCANSNCSFEKDYNSDYCGSCTCNTSGCKNPHIANGYHCTDHTCAAAGCTSEKSYGGPYCFSHTCASCDNIRVDGGFYCVDHTCIVSGCTQIKGPSCDYCTSHQCMAGTCKNCCIDGGDYCEEHTCIVEGCNKQKLTSDYCYYHTP